MVTRKKCINKALKLEYKNKFTNDRKMDIST